MKEYIYENGDKRLASEEDGEHWIDIANREYLKEIDEVIRNDIINRAVSYLEKDTFVKMKTMPLPPTNEQGVEEIRMWYKHMLHKMALNAGKTDEEMIQYLQELDRNPPSTVETPADPTGSHLKNLKKGK